MSMWTRVLCGLLIAAFVMLSGFVLVDYGLDIITRTIGLCGNYEGGCP